jgi:hypothetical protein
LAATAVAYHFGGSDRFFCVKIRSFGLVMRGKHGKDFSAQYPIET